MTGDWAFADWAFAVAFSEMNLFVLLTKLVRALWYPPLTSNSAAASV
jgi:hypothetical protein